MIPRDVRELHSSDVAAAAIIAQILNDAPADAVLEHWIGQSLPELLASAGERPGWNEDVQSSRTRGIRILIEHHIGAR